MAGLESKGGAFAPKAGMSFLPLLGPQWVSPCSNLGGGNDWFLPTEMSSLYRSQKQASLRAGTGATKAREGSPVCPGVSDLRAGGLRI